MGMCAITLLIKEMRPAIKMLVHFPQDTDSNIKKLLKAIPLHVQCVIFILNKLIS